MPPLLIPGPFYRWESAKTSRPKPLSRNLRGPFSPVAHVGFPPSPTLSASRPGYSSPSTASIRLRWSLASLAVAGQGANPRIYSNGRYHPLLFTTNISESLAWIEMSMVSPGKVCTLTSSTAAS